LFILENLKIELLKFINCILIRINITNQRLPAHLKIQAIELLEETKCFVSLYLTQLECFDLKNDSELLYYLECYFSCGLVYLIQFRYSIISSNDKDLNSSVTYSQSSLSDLNNYLNDLNIHLTDKIKNISLKKSINYMILFYLVSKIFL
jgi:hypothetical protein